MVKDHGSEVKLPTKNGQERLDARNLIVKRWNMRVLIFIGGAVLGARSRTPVLYIAESWGGAR